MHDARCALLKLQKSCEHDLYVPSNYYMYKLLRDADVPVNELLPKMGNWTAAQRATAVELLTKAIKVSCSFCFWTVEWAKAKVSISH